MNKKNYRVSLSEQTEIRMRCVEAVIPVASQHNFKGEEVVKQCERMYRFVIGGLPLEFRKDNLYPPDVSPSEPPSTPGDGEPTE